MPVLRYPRHERLVREFLKNGGNAADAYRKTWKAYPGKPLIAKKSPAVIACRILQYPHVKARLEELQTQMAKKADITMEKILSDYQHALNLGKAQGKAGDIVAAATAQAKLVGLLRDRVEAGAPGDFDNLDSVGEILTRVEEEAGTQVAAALAKAFGIENWQQTPPERSEEETVALLEADAASDAVN